MKREEYILKEVPLDDMENILYRKSQEGCRLIQMHANYADHKYEIFYSFGKDMSFETYKIVIGENDTIHSISSIFPNATLFENEIKELFGVEIKFIDKFYDNRFYRIDKETPFKE